MKTILLLIASALLLTGCFGGAHHATPWGKAKQPEKLCKN